ncbi:right-handed parallel beta-helix repeat-containing protein [Nitrospira sp. M1]
MGKSIIEVATRAQLVRVSRLKNFVIQGLQFQHSASAIAQHGAVHISGSQNILIEDNRFVLNNWAGLGFSRVRNVTTRRNIMHHNGGIGWKGIWIKSLLSEHDSIRFNNWRGVKGNFLRWDAGGIKHLHIHEATYNNIIASNNMTRGLWLDTDNSDIIINRACLCANLTDGLKIEASPGPIRIENSRMCNNKRHGFQVNTGRRIMLRNNVFANNKEYPIQITGSKVRSMINWESRQKLDVRTQDWTMIGNVMFSHNKSLFTLPNWSHFFDTLYSNDNVWHARTTNKIFGLGREGNFIHLTLKEWMQQMQHDKNSHKTLPKRFSQPTCL